MVPVTVYVVVVAGLAVTLAVFVAFSPADGLHTYVVAPLAVKAVPVGEPLHMATSAPAEVTGTVVKFNTIASLDEPQLFVAV